MAGVFHGAVNSKRQLVRKNGPKRADTAGSIGPGRSTRYEKRKDAKAQRRKAADLFKINVVEPEILGQAQIRRAERCRPVRAWRKSGTLRRFSYQLWREGRGSGDDQRRDMKSRSTYQSIIATEANSSKAAPT